MDSGIYLFIEECSFGHQILAVFGTVRFGYPGWGLAVDA